VSTFLAPRAKDAVVGAVRAVEDASSVEVVVAVRGRSDAYRDVDYLVGVFLAIVTISILIFHPAPLDEALMPLETLFAFLGGSMLASIPACKRVLVPGKRLRGRTLEAARAQFVESGIARKRTRTGILIYVSLLERQAHMVADTGVHTSALGAAFAEQTQALDAAVAQNDVDAFAAALKAMAPMLAKEHPRIRGQVNELPDAPEVKA